MDAGAVLAGKTNSSVAMAFGMAVQSDPKSLPHGALAALADDLARRGLLGELLSELGAERRQLIGLQITIDRARARRTTRTARDARAPR